VKDGQGIEIKAGSWNIPPIFAFLEKHGKINPREMFNIYNMGIGMIIALNKTEADKAIAVLTAHGEKAAVIGGIVEGEGVRIIEN